MHKHRLLCAHLGHWMGAPHLLRADIRLQAWLAGLESFPPTDRSKHDFLSEHFLSASQREPPDIDIDFGYECREEITEVVPGKTGQELKLGSPLVGGRVRWRVAKNQRTNCATSSLSDLSKNRDFLEYYVPHSLGTIVELRSARYLS